MPTIGRRTLIQTVQSIPRQWQILVVADGEHAAAQANLFLKKTRAQVIETERTDAVGHPQRNIGMRLADTEWVAFMDDDDTYVPNVDQLVGPQHPLPHIYRMRYTNGNTLWTTHQVQEGNVGTPMFVVPNDPRRLAEWPSRRSGDFVFIRDTCQLYEQKPVFVDTVIALVRPHETR